MSCPKCAHLSGEIKRLYDDCLRLGLLEPTAAESKTRGLERDLAMATQRASQLERALQNVERKLIDERKRWGK